MVRCAGLDPPEKQVPMPRHITFQRKRANRRVVNEEQLIELLREFGEVRARFVSTKGIW